MKNFQDKPADPKRLSILKRTAYIGLIVVALAETAVVHWFQAGQGHFPFEKIPAFSALFGFAASLTLIRAAKFIGGNWLLKREDYYD